jgi:hypothetical protein
MVFAGLYRRHTKKIKADVEIIDCHPELVSGSAVKNGNGLSQGSFRYP